MSKNVAVVYYSGTGNTEAMAKALADEAKKLGAEVSVVESDAAKAADILAADAVALGSPATGKEQLEAKTVAPLWNELKGQLGDKPVVLFGSYGWGGGKWMETWEADAKDAGVNVVKTVVSEKEPGDEVLAELAEAAKLLA